jgi:hypothetical protein
MRGGPERGSGRPPEEAACGGADVPMRFSAESSHGQCNREAVEFIPFTVKNGFVLDKAVLPGKTNRFHIKAMNVQLSIVEARKIMASSAARVPKFSGQLSAHKAIFVGDAQIKTVVAFVAPRHTGRVRLARRERFEGCCHAASGLHCDRRPGTHGRFPNRLLHSRPHLVMRLSSISCSPFSEACEQSEGSLVAIEVPPRPNVFIRS